ncbi:MAG: DUF3160 domain-containing protein, partial [Candidatus Altiarchaeales archaeon]|nr:DUF3160 domain-containing protein [Candidatus Altiarchaeales archaeon]
HIEFKTQLTRQPIPEIYGGVGGCGLVGAGNKKHPHNCLKASAGLRLMGQRFVFDGYVFQNLLNPANVGAYNGSAPRPFTHDVNTRVFPRGLDLMSILGSSEATRILKSSGDTNYLNYFDSHDKLAKQFNDLSVGEWNKNLYFSWMYALKSCLKEDGGKYPAFMRTKAYQRKQLNTALASWSELRHDTRLYAKQSYTLREASPPLRKTVSGYVEPNPELYSRLFALTKMTSEALSAKKLLTKDCRKRLTDFEEMLLRLKAISVKELEGGKLSEGDARFINDFSENADLVLAGVDDKSRKTTLIAGVHTDSDSKQTVWEGVGYVDLMLTVFRLPGKKTQVGAGPVFTYYEFKHPMDDRLTDGVWREMLGEDPPRKPAWTRLYADET